MPPPSKPVQLANEFLAAPDALTAAGVDERARLDLNVAQKAIYAEEKKRGGAEQGRTPRSRCRTRSSCMPLRLSRVY